MIYIIILNWNNWYDTIECLESVFRCKYKNYKVIVCDNNSSDNSLYHIRQWADGNVDIVVKKDNPLRKFSFPPIQKPMKCMELSREEAEMGGPENIQNVSLILIRIERNLGFAGGNNVGLRYVLAREDFKYVWMLNNDTIVEPDALGEVLKRAEMESKSGICGSTILYYDNPNSIQAMGGATYNKWFGIVRHIGENKKAEDVSSLGDDVESRMEYVMGASMLVSKDLLNCVGLMREEYFLFFEELDWALRARKMFPLLYASKSIVYHKQGSRSGSTPNPFLKSGFSDFYLLRNRLRITKYFFPYSLPTIYVSIVLSLLLRIYRGQWENLKDIFKLYMNSK
jgi:GT2 family glycosyltransferase